MDVIKSILQFDISPISQYHLNNVYLLNETFAFERCRCSALAETRDTNNNMNVNRRFQRWIQQHEKVSNKNISNNPQPLVLLVQWALCLWSVGPGRCSRHSDNNWLSFEMGRCASVWVRYSKLGRDGSITCTADTVTIRLWAKIFHAFECIINRPIQTKDSLKSYYHCWENKL